MGCDGLAADRSSAVTSKVGDIFNVCHKITQKSDTGCDTTMTRADVECFCATPVSKRRVAGSYR